MPKSIKIEKFSPFNTLSVLNIVNLAEKRTIVDAITIKMF
jgi:hypothetical protein